ncbi:MAG: PrgI family protein [Candidatus Staskawiczbacteria bacterium]|nr:PrgI family protein [Candidatus Staskawiczbacteria bacterium]
MDRYPIPQFIEAEGKIAFFITFSQFFYMVGAGVVCFVLYFILPRFLFFLLMPIVVLGTAGFAFIKINGVPLLNIVLSSVGFATGAKNYTWKKRESPYPFKPIQRARIKKIEEGPVLQAQRSQLRKMHTKLETKSKQ